MNTGKLIAGWCRGAAAMALATGLSVPGHADTYVVGMPAGGSAAEKAVLAATVTKLLHDADVGDVFYFYDAANLVEIGSPVTITEEMGPDQPDTVRDKALLVARGPITAFLDKASGDAGVNAPAFMTYVGDNVVPMTPDHKLNIGVFGPVFYNDKREPTYSMANGYYPSDGHLLLTNTRSPYGVAGREKVLAGTNTAYCYTDPTEAFRGEDYRIEVSDFWGKYISGQGSRVTMVGPLNDDCLSHFLSGTPSARTYAVNADDAKAVMRLDPRWTTHVVTAAPDRCDRLPDVLHSANIAADWDGPADVAIYVRTNPDEEWARVSSIYKIRTGANHAGLDSSADIDTNKLRVALNLNSGGAPGGVDVTLKISAQCTLSGRFHIPAERGNGGAGIGAMPKPYWVKIDLHAMQVGAGAS